MRLMNCLYCIILYTSAKSHCPNQQKSSLWHSLLPAIYFCISTLDQKISRFHSTSTIQCFTLVHATLFMMFGSRNRRDFSNNAPGYDVTITEQTFKYWKCINGPIVSKLRIMHSSMEVMKIWRNEDHSFLIRWKVSF